MSNTSTLDSQSLEPEAIEDVLRSLSDYFIPLNRLKFHDIILGEGSFGTVERANLYGSWWRWFLMKPTTVAVKKIRRTDMGLRIAFRLAREIRVWASCNHPQIMKFTGYYSSKDFRQVYLVCPYMKGGNVKQYLAKERPTQEQRLKLVRDTIQGLAYLHSGHPPIVHGDLKPENVLVNDGGDASLVDFGLAKVQEGPSGLTTGDGFQGSIRYWSPELLKGSPIERTSDIWAWGCVALEICTDNPPYPEIQQDTQILPLISGPEHARRTPEPSDSSSIQPELLQVLRKCWNFEPSQRPDAMQCAEMISASKP